jgi:hypothetical protein
MTPDLGRSRLRAMDLGQILDETLAIWRRNFLTFTTAMAVVLLPVAVLLSAVTVLAGISLREDPSAERIISAVLVALPFTVLTLAGSLLSSGAAIALASDAILGRPLDIASAYRTALRRALPLLWAFFLAGLLLTLLSITVLGIPVAVFLGIGWVVAAPVVILERGQGAGLRRSSWLVDRHRWRALGVVTVMSLLIVVLAAIPSAIVTLLLAGIGAMVPESPTLRTAFEIVNTLVSTAAQILFSPLSWIGLTVLYYELRVRKEAFDLEQLAAQAGGPSVISTGRDEA